MTIAVVQNQAIPLHHNTQYANSWHTPRNQKDYERSPQKALWRSAKEFKMDAYVALDMWIKRRRKDLPSGAKVLRTLWAFKIKFNGKGVFEKLNPRWSSWHNLAGD